MINRPPGLMLPCLTVCHPVRNWRRAGGSRLLFVELILYLAAVLRAPRKFVCQKPSREIRISQIANFGLSTSCCNRIGSFCNPYAKGSFDLVNLSKFGLGEGSNAVLRNPGARARHLKRQGSRTGLYAREGGTKKGLFLVARSRRLSHPPPD